MITIEKKKTKKFLLNSFLIFLVKYLEIRRCFNMSKIKKIAIAIAALIFLVFACICGAWLVHYDLNIKPMLSNEKLILQDNNGKWTIYSYSDDNASYSVSVPSFLNFSGDLSAITSINYNENWEPVNNYTIGFCYSPRLFSDQINKYWFTIYDYSNAEDPSVPPAAYDIYTTGSLELIDESGSGKFEEYYVPIKEFYDKIKNFFGEDTFK